MKKVTTILAAILLMAVGAAAQKLSYQAVVRNSSNELVPNTALTVEVSILDAVGAVQYAETHSATTNQNGLLVLTIGDGTVTAGTTVADVNWNGAAIQSVVKNGGAVVATITSPVNAKAMPIMICSSLCFGRCRTNFCRTAKKPIIIRSDFATSMQVSSSRCQNALPKPDATW